MKYSAYRVMALVLLISTYALGQACCMGLAIGADASGGVYVMDGRNDTLMKLDESGKVIRKWRPNAKQEDWFNMPVTMAVGRNGHVYLGSFDDYHVLDMGLALDFVKGWSLDDMVDHRMLGPEGLAVDSKGNVYVLSKSVVRLSPAGKRLAEWRDGNEDFILPRAVAVDATGNIYVATGTGSYCETEDGEITESREVEGQILQFDPTGKRIGSWKSDDKNGGRFDSPSGIAFDSAGNMYVTDRQYSTVQKFDKTGKRVLAWKLKGMVTNPTGIAVGRNDRIYVAEKFDEEVHVFDSSGKQLATWTLPGNKWGD